jgi:hypothetical protein
MAKSRSLEPQEVALLTGRLADSAFTGRLADLLTSPLGREEWPEEWPEERPSYRDVFTDDRGRRWSVTTAWDLFDGRIEPVEVVIRAVPPGPLTAEALRRLPLGTRFNEIRQEIASIMRHLAVRHPPWEELTEDERSSWLAFLDAGWGRPHSLAEAERAYRWMIPVDLTDEDRAAALAVADGLEARKGRTLTSDHLHVVADVYRTAWREGADPRRAVAEHFHLSDSGAAKRIRAARDAGVLGPARPGKAGEA